MSDTFLSTDLLGEFGCLQRRMAVSFRRPASLRATRSETINLPNISRTEDAVAIIAFAPGLIRLRLTFRSTGDC